MRIDVDSRLRLTDPPEALVKELVRRSQCRNPKYDTAVKQGRSTWKIPEKIIMWTHEADSWTFPRGLAGWTLEWIKRAGIKYHWNDSRWNWPFSLRSSGKYYGALMDYQIDAVSEMARHSCGLLQVPCGSGKTVMLSALLAEIGQRSLILCQAEERARQLKSELSRWLGRPIGFLDDEEDELTGDVDVSTIQCWSDYEKTSFGVVSGFIGYGLVAIDEANNIPARFFPEVVERFQSTYRFGMMTPLEENDGVSTLLHSVIGPVRAVISPDELGKLRCEIKTSPISPDVPSKTLRGTNLEE